MIALRANRLFDGRNEHEEAVLLIEGGRIRGIVADALLARTQGRLRLALQEIGR